MVSNFAQKKTSKTNPNQTKTEMAAVHFFILLLPFSLSLFILKHIKAILTLCIHLFSIPKTTLDS